MSSLLVAGIVFLSAFGGALVGMVLARALPHSHLHAESKDVIRLGTGLIATMAALVLGLLVGAAKSSFDAQATGFRQMATNVMLLDKTLQRYGPETAGAREALRHVVDSTINSLWPPDGSAAESLGNSHITADGSAFYDEIRKLQPRDDAQKFAQSMAFQTANELARIRWSLSYQDDATLPRPFLSVLAFWLFVLFMSFGLFAPRNATVFCVLLVSAMSVAGAILLIVDLDQPFDGLLKVSGSSLRAAAAQLGK